MRPVHPFLSVLPLLLAIPASAEEGLEFSVEPESGETFSHSGELEAGSEIHLEIRDLPGDQRFLANRCGPGCKTAELVFAVAGRGLEVMRRTFGIEETGRYYFYVQKRDETGATGPVPILGLHPEPEGFVAEFSGGATVRGRVGEPAPPAPEASATPSAEDAVEILSVSPETVTRGVPFEVVVHVLVSLDSELEARVGLGFNGKKPGRFDRVDSRSVSSGTRQLTFVADVIPVDWGERGDFSVFAFLLPLPTDTRGPQTPLASDTKKLEVLP